MPLSEHEQRVLEEIERQLAVDDPKLVARSQRVRPRRPGRTLKPRRTRLLLSIVGCVLGFASLLGLAFHIAWGYIGFGLLLVSVTALVHTLREDLTPTMLRRRGGDAEVDDDVDKTH